MPDGQDLYTVTPEEEEEEDKELEKGEGLPDVVAEVQRVLDAELSPNTSSAEMREAYNQALRALGREPSPVELAQIVLQRRAGVGMGEEGEAAAGGVSAAAEAKLPDLTPEERFVVESTDGLSVTKAKLLKYFGYSGPERILQGTWELFRIPTTPEQEDMKWAQDLIASGAMTGEDFMAAAALMPGVTKEEIELMVAAEYTPQDFDRVRNDYESLGLEGFGYTLEDTISAEKTGTTPMALQQAAQAERRAAEAERRGVSPEWLMYGGTYPPGSAAAQREAARQAEVPFAQAGYAMPEARREAILTEPTAREVEEEWEKLPLAERLAFGMPGAEAEATALEEEREHRAELQETIREGIAGGPYYGRGRWAVEGLTRVSMPAMRLWAEDIRRAFGPEVAAQGVAGIRGAFESLTPEQMAQAHAGELPRYGGGEPAPIMSAPIPQWAYRWGDYQAAMAAYRKRDRGEELTGAEQNLINQAETRHRFYQQTHPVPEAPAAEAPTTGGATAGTLATARMPSVAPEIPAPTSPRDRALRIARGSRRRRGMPRIPKSPAGFRNMPSMG